jgi:hypothetical protein
MRQMKLNTYLKTTLILSIGGTLFAGYLSGVKFFEKTCAFNETCPYFLGFPACYFGFALFSLLLISTVAAYLNKSYKNLVVKINTVVSGLGVLFAVYISIQDLMVFSRVAGSSYTLLLPTCVYGGVFFAIVFVLSAINLKK